MLRDLCIVKTFLYTAVRQPGLMGQDCRIFQTPITSVSFALVAAIEAQPLVPHVPLKAKS
jgi:hypothetical protein